MSAPTKLSTGTMGQPLVPCSITDRKAVGSVSDEPKPTRHDFRSTGGHSETWVKDGAEKWYDHLTCPPSCPMAAGSPHVKPVKDLRPSIVEEEEVSGNGSPGA